MTIGVIHKRGGERIRREVQGKKVDKIYERRRRDACIKKKLGPAAEILTVLM